MSSLFTRHKISIVSKVDKINVFEQTNYSLCHSPNIMTMGYDIIKSTQIKAPFNQRFIYNIKFVPTTIGIQISRYQKIGSC